MKFTEKARKQIKERSGERCEVCGSLALNPQIHHRRPRGMGGSKDPVCGSPANGIWIHPACHAKIEGWRLWAYDHGYLVKQNHDPRYIPIKIGLFWYLLDDEGNKKMWHGPMEFTDATALKRSDATTDA